jgi:ribose 5-phosphate isomerase B
MIVAIACDHAGYPLKEAILEVVRAAGHGTMDIGTFSTVSIDYPDVAASLGNAILQGKADRGILLCGSGVGACIAANKIHGIYAGVCHDTYSAHQGVEHDDMNVLCIGARIVGEELAKELVIAFLGACFNNEERHQRRVNKVRKIERDGLASFGT